MALTRAAALVGATELRPSGVMYIPIDTNMEGVDAVQLTGVMEAIGVRIVIQPGGLAQYVRVRILDRSLLVLVNLMEVLAELNPRPDRTSSRGGVHVNKDRGDDVLRLVEAHLQTMHK